MEEGLSELGKPHVYNSDVTKVEFVMKQQLGSHLLAVCRATFSPVDVSGGWIYNLNSRPVSVMVLDKAFSWSMF